MTVHYEFVVEQLDYYEGCGDDPDIIDTTGFEGLTEAEEFTHEIEPPFTWRIALRRDRGNEVEGLVERHYAYPDENGKLPERLESGTGFDDGPPVPARFKSLRFPAPAERPRD